MAQIKMSIAEWLSRREPSREIPFLLFCATSLQLAFLFPYLVLVPDERANLFSGLLCALALAAACVAGGGSGSRRVSVEVWISVALGILMILSGLGSRTPASSSLRGLGDLAAGLGGFWCARILLATDSRRRAFVWLGLAMLAGILLVSLISYGCTGTVNAFLDSNPHPLATKVLLLWFAPLTLLVGGSPSVRAAAALLILASYVVFFLSSLRSAMLIPLVLCLVASVYGRLAFKHLLWIALVLVIVIGNFFYRLPKEKLGKEYEPAYYRAESYPFSFHIASKHPFLGIGLRAPREEYVQDYRINYPYVTKEKFVDSVMTIRSSENIFLTVMVELGLPFLLLYAVSLIVLMRRLLRWMRFPVASGALAPVALLLPLTAALLHGLVFDVLLHPQVNWFFHVLLGLIPVEKEVAAV